MPTKPRYWVLAPVEASDPAMYDKVWAYDLANSTVSIGWQQLGDVSTLDKEELFESVALTFADKSRPTIGLIANTFWNFFHEIQPGDIIVARRGLMILSAIGTVIGNPNYNTIRKTTLTTSTHCHTHNNWLEVNWQEQPRNVSFGTPVFQMQTLTKIPEDRYLSLLESIQKVKIDVPNKDMKIPEKFLEELLVRNFDSIFKGEIKIYEDVEGYNGQQFETLVGIIDILAIDTITNDYVIIELKKGQTSDKTIGQILRYMGWAKKHMCKPEQKVRGIIICEGHDDKLNYALDMIADVSVKYFKLSFELSESNAIKLS